MFKDRSKLFFFTTVVECCLAISFLIFSSASVIMTAKASEFITVGTLYFYTGSQTTGILLVISAVLSLIGFIYKNKDLIRISTVLTIVSLVTDFFGSIILIAFQHSCDETVLLGSVCYLLLILIMIVILIIAFDDQMKKLKEIETTSKKTKKSLK